VKAHAHHGGSADAEIEPGRTTDVKLCIPKGIDARGRVLAPDGQPVAGASVAVGHSSEDLLEAARTDANGVFFLRSLEPKKKVAAYAEGYAKSTIRSADEFAGGTVDLTLTAKGGSVIGRVLDATGQPLVGAWVSHGYAGENGDGPRTISMGSALTDAAGTFRLCGVRLGLTWPLFAGAAGHATWRGEVRARVDEAVFVEIRLSRAVVVSGTVRDAERRPVRGSVSVLDGNTPPKGPRGQVPRWCRTSMATADDGRYAITNVLAGELVVSAWDGSPDPHQAASRSFTAQPGELLTWDPILTGDLAIRGIALDDGGSPLVGWLIAAKVSDDAVKHTTTSRDGCFALTGCAAIPYTVTCATPGDWSQTVLERRGVEPGGEPLVLCVSRAARPSGVILGRLAPDQPRGELSILLMDERLGGWLEGPLAAGQAFQFGPLPPGRYALQLRGKEPPGGDGLFAALGTCDLQVGQRYDFGDVRMPAPGELAVELADVQGRPVATASLMLRPVGDASSAAIQIADGRGTARLIPGRYLPGFCTDDAHIEHEPLTITAGQRTEVRLQLCSAVLRRMTFDTSQMGVPLRAVAVFKKAGIPLHCASINFWQEERPTILDQRFTPGAWELELELGTGMVQRFPFLVSVDDIGPDIAIRIAK
jgi:hypothetical protein